MKPSLLLVVVVAPLALFFAGCEDQKNPDNGGDGSTVISQATPIQTPCADGRLLTKNSYSECIANTWHVVEDDTYSCPPNKTYRVSDDDTKQACGGGQAPPDSFGPHFRDLQGDTSCLSAKKKIEDQVLWRCNRTSGLWEYSKVTVYQCPDGTTGIIGTPTWIPTTATCSQWGGKPPVDQVK